MSRIEQLTQQIQELEKELAVEKRKAEVLYLIQKTDDCWKVHSDGCISQGTWEGYPYEKNLYAQGNVFHTQEEAEKERDKREILMRFNQFRDKCNGDWKPTINEKKYYIFFNFEEQKFKIDWFCQIGIFELLGTFKNEADAERAVELFGDEIKRLFVEEE